MKRLLARLLLGITLLGAVVPAFAHKASDAYLQIRSGAQGTSARIDVALRDLDPLLDLDADADGRLTWGEVRRAWPRIEQAVRAGLQIDGCALGDARRSLERRGDGTYAALEFRADCVLGPMPSVRYTLLADVDPTHRGLLRLERDGAAPLLRVLDPTRPEAPAATARGSFVAEGVHHIVTGADHLLFLLCLLLPAVMRRERTSGGLRWRPVERPSDAVWPVLGIVSAFTLAHSLTLGLSAAQWVSLPASFIEPAIAATIVLAAIDNLRPLLPGPRWLVTFVFGLVHGFGFAGVLGELDLPRGEFAWALLQFNLGLELGQSVIVLAAVGLLYGLRARRRYPSWVIGGGSVAALLAGALWFVERTAPLALPM
ncbi:MAG: HupE/UreJ family protein [Piscinibacter sp.]|nr:HupE/UreJ family protein [Piscinibacter sp.]